MQLSDTEKLRLMNILLADLDAGTIEILLKVDSSGEHDFVSVSDVPALISEYKIR